MSTNQTIRDLTKEERMELKTELMGEQSCKALAFQTLVTKKFGPAAGMMLRQLVFWEGASELEDGWLYKSRREMREETGLSQRQQDKARKTLQGVGILEVETRPVGTMKRPTLHYRVDLERVMNKLHPPDDTDVNRQGVSDTGRAKAVHVPESSRRIKYPNHQGVSGIQKNTSGENFPVEDGSVGHAAGQLLNSNTVKEEPTASRPRDLADNVPEKRSAAWVVDELDDFLYDVREFSLTPDQCSAYEKQARELLERNPGVTEDELRSAIRRKVMRWSAYPKLPLEEALQDVRSGHESKGMFGDWTSPEQQDELWELWSDVVREDPKAEIREGFVYYTDSDGTRMMMFPDGGEFPA